jgi:hypothetical protein
MRSILIAAICLGLTACADAMPKVHAISDSAVTIRANWRTNEADVVAKANESCGIYGKSAVPVSSRCMNGICSWKEFLFACGSALAQERSVGAPPQISGPGDYSGLANGGRPADTPASPVFPTPADGAPLAQSTSDARWKVAFPAYVQCMESYMGPRLRDFGVRGVPITEGRVTVLAENAHQTCRAEAIDASIALRDANDGAPDLSDDEIAHRLKVMVEAIYLLDAQNGDRCYGLFQKYCY